MLVFICMNVIVTEVYTIFEETIDDEEDCNILQTQQQPQQQFVCTACGRSYKYSYNLQKHKELECGKERQFQCKICLKKYFQSQVLYRHLRTVHRNDLQQ